MRSKSTAHRTLLSKVLAIVLLIVAVPEVLALDPTYSPSQYTPRIWRIEDGLPQNSVHTIAQTKDGYLWCGTESGLARFDGTKFKVFNSSNTPELKSNSINALLADRNDVLWIATENGLVKYEQGNFSRLTMAEGLVDDDTWSLAEDPNGGMWVGTKGGLSYYSDKKFTNFTKENGLPASYCLSLHMGKNGELWIGTTNGLSKFAKGKFTSYSDPKYLNRDRILSICSASDGGILVGKRSGLSIFRNEKFSSVENFEESEKSFVRAMAEDRDGNHWLGTNFGLIRQLKSGVCQGFSKESSLGETIFAIFEDREGSLWVGTADGLVRLINGRCLTITGAEGLLGSTNWVVHEDRLGSIWVGTSGGLSRLKDGKWSIFTPQDCPIGDTVLAIAEDEKGVLWFGSGLGLCSYDQKEFKNHKLSSDFFKNDVLAILPEEDGSVLLGTGNGELVKFQNDKFEVVFKGSSSRKRALRAILKSSRKELWMGTNGGGIWVRRGEQFINYTTRDGLSSDVILCLTELKDGSILVGTHGAGLNRYYQGKWTTYLEKDGLGDNTIYQILEDGEYLWMSSSRGIFRIAQDSLSGKSPIQSLTLNRRDGMKIDDCNGGSQPAGCKTRNGRLWFPTGNGLVVVNPSRVQSQRPTPPVSIDKIIVDGKVEDGKSPIRLTPTAGALEVHYSAIDMVALDGLRFRYKLEGFDQNWIEAGNRRVAFYTNLPPNKYVFRVQVAEPNAEWADTDQSFEFELTPRFYQTRWFYVVCGLIALGLFGAAHQYNTYQFKSREKLLAACIEQRTQELRKEVEEHARTGELLRHAQKLEAVGKLAGGVAHDFNNLLTVIIGYTDMLMTDERMSKQHRSLISEVRTAGGRAEKLTSQLLAFSRRQLLQPKLIDPNALISETRRMLQRVISEKISISSSLHPNIWRIKVDPTQLQQVIINLAINARDAMPNGGQLKFSSRNVHFDRNHRALPPDVEPGDYVELSVQDNGQGMSEEVKAQIFEPFFTTKEQGKGTGLGLATAYGIVRQSNGFILVDSALNQGSKFTIYLPKMESGSVEESRSSTLESLPIGKGTILLVEDEAAVRKVARTVLINCGYQVLEAEDGEDALKVASEHHGSIQMLVTDVVMPRLSGRELANRLVKIRRDIKVLFVSGYTDDELLRSDISEANYKFLQKPYTPKLLAGKIRELLDQSDKVTA
ncbi:response regulator [Telmatocola sphagniphila]|uniref:histidine kinase n=1 Tax=Telmatocola sphagniphila TaxID=1123043 RepID=A0A8E6B8Q1_9BACT|nr:hybrid sensor histidine kinase/response regulator [Telmatocola sphagniphila]QVL34200.1 response regulator [Telmatocola sphagniphila]